MWMVAMRWTRGPSTLLSQCHDEVIDEKDTASVRRSIGVNRINPQHYGGVRVIVASSRTHNVALKCPPNKIDT
jgi:hypothetical protein